MNMRGAARRLWLALVILFVLPGQALAARELIPVGQVIGLQLKSDALTVAAYDENIGGEARAAGLKIGDEILSINGTAVDSAQDVRNAIQTGQKLSLEVRRAGKTSTVEMVPVQTGNGPRLGVYLRQGIAGIGTVTFYDPETGLFGTLGHGVCDSKGKLLQMQEGFAYPASVLSVKKGVSGQPGQLKGSAENRSLGRLVANTGQGVFGISPGGWAGETVQTGEFSQIQSGSAVIRSTIDETGPREYSVEILKIYPQDRSDGRNFLLRVTDPELLEKTGGIVQGMSGSPILQNGKLIGAVTHVLVNDPTMGYGIYIGNMLEAAA